jgi:hypothetical protein
MIPITIISHKEINAALCLKKDEEKLNILWLGKGTLLSYEKPFMLGEHYTKQIWSAICAMRKEDV